MVALLSDIRHLIRRGGNHPRNTASTCYRKSRTRYRYVCGQHRPRDRRDAVLPTDRPGGHRDLVVRDDYRPRDRLPWSHHDRDARRLSLARVIGEHLVIH